jgi:hypothetical protein
MKGKNHILILKNTEETFDKIQHSFMIKILNELSITGMYLNIIKPYIISQQPTANIIVNGEKMKAF